MSRPKLACCNFIPNFKELRQFALEYGFAGIDWTFTSPSMPQTRSQLTDLVKGIAGLYPLEVRYHCAFSKTDLGDGDAEEARKARQIFYDVCRLVSKLRGRYLTIHVGLGRDSTIDLSWDSTIIALADLVRFANNIRLRLCLENLAWGWTSRPELFEKLIRKSGCWATLDIGHARVSPSIMSGYYEVEDFVFPQRERFLNAHIYHEENENGHIPPKTLADIKDRLHLLSELPLCDWWVLELREEKALLDTLSVVRDFFNND
ncbi:MAG: TIM barrel protein [Desulfobacca sp.]|nr:TIM barrel protein [Desulfobacca sp.]